MEHLDEPSTDTGLKFGTISGDLDFSVGIPGVPQASGAIEG